MVIEDMRKKRVRLIDLSIGELFKIETNNSVYMRTDEVVDMDYGNIYMSVNLLSGEHSMLEGSRKVETLEKATLRIEA